jgi:hypothetical protein
MDIEGAELAALQTASALFSGKSAPILILEYNHDVALRNGWDLHRLGQALMTLGYTAWPLRENGIGPALDPDNTPRNLLVSGVKIDLLAALAELPLRLAPVLLAYLFADPLNLIRNIWIL